MGICTVSDVARIRDAGQEPGVHYWGRYRISVQWDGQAFAYEVCMAGSNTVLRSGFDMLSLNEETAVQGIISRLCGEGRQ